jgi:hypothetical protein
MQTVLEAPIRRAAPATPTVARTLDGLAVLDCSALEAMFASAAAFPLQALHGHPRGRVLAIPRRDAGAVFAVLRVLHASSWWPWEGKSFHSQPGIPEGVGINRVRGPLRRGVFPFRTYETASVIDGRPSVAIDYEVPRNPRVAHPIYDEVRRVGDGLYLGRGMRRRAGVPKLVLWFALDTNIADRPVAFRDIG